MHANRYFLFLHYHDDIFSCSSHYKVHLSLVTNCFKLAIFAKVIIVLTLCIRLKKQCNLGMDHYFIVGYGHIYCGEKVLFDNYLHFLKLHIINTCINSLFIWSWRLPLRPHVVAGSSMFSKWKHFSISWLSIICNGDILLKFIFHLW